MKMLNEASGLHFGDLEIAKKADARGIMSDRGTGHFGTGFYFVSDRYKNANYHDRALWDIDYSAYNLYKPRSNSEAYKLHDALKALNNCFFMYHYRHLSEELLNKSKYDLERELDDLEYEKDNEGILEFINKYNSNAIDEYYYLREAIDHEKWGAVEEFAHDEIIKAADKFKDMLRRALFDLHLIFIGKIAEDKIKSIVWKLIKDESLDETDADSISTLFMKALGYEGIDVTHLNHDAQGLAGPDNFAYGSVIYDLKPGTYKKIRDKKES